MKMNTDKLLAAMKIQAWIAMGSLAFAFYEINIIVRASITKEKWDIINLIIGAIFGTIVGMIIGTYFSGSHSTDKSLGEIPTTNPPANGAGTN